MVSLAAAYALAGGDRVAFRASMATAYVSLALLGASLATGPLNVLRGRPNPVSTDLRRDLGIWAAVVAIAHFAVGLQVHMKHRWEYWFTPASGGLLLPRVDPFGFANHTGLAAVAIAALLLALSNDRSLRALGTARWKRLQRWNYALYGLVLLHGIAYQVTERRTLPWVALFVAMLLPALVLQVAGRRARRVAASVATGRDGR